ncbi:MAG: copper amine oxidase N-terminal domain-containing protein [Dehalobacterium sp.]
MKKYLVVLTIVLLMLLSVGAVNAQSQIGVTIDGEEVIFTDAAPFIDENSRTLIPLRAAGEAMGLTVDWDPQQGATFTKEYSWDNAPLHKDLDDDGEIDAYLGLEKVVFKIGENKAIYEESWYDKDSLPDINFPIEGGIGEITMDTAAIIKDSRIYAPMRYLAEAFRYYVGWEANTVVLNYMTSCEKLGIEFDMIACWEDSQGWLFTVDEASEIQALNILNVTLHGNNLKPRELTEDEQLTVYESGEDFGKYLKGFVVENNLTNNTYYQYQVKFTVTMKDGSEKFGFANFYLYYRGDQGGYI